MRERNKKHLTYMHQALELALRARGQTSPNPLVGALVVKNNRVVASGYHRRCGSAHAEIVALKKAKNKAKGATLYVTLEPCSHFGRTPPCVDAIIKSGIKKVIVGMKDPNPLNNGKSLRKLKKAGLKVEVGFLKKELQEMNELFIKYITTRMPFIVVKTAQTIDGKIATASGQSKWITSKKTRDFSHRMRADFDAIMVGAGTVIKDNPRLNATAGRRIKKIILDSSLKISPKAKLFRGTATKNIFIATTKKAPKAKVQRFVKKGINVLICPGNAKRVPLKYVFKELAKKEITSVLIEGGAEVIGSALKEQLVDKVLVFISLKIMGDQEAISAVKGLKPRNIRQAIRLKGISLWRIADDLLVEAYVCRNC